MAELVTPEKTENKPKQPNLAWLIIRDWLDNKALLALALLVLVSACSVIYFAWKNRELNTELQLLQDKKDRLDVDWRHMLLEHNALSEHSRVEKIAREQLDMKRPDAKDEKIIKLK